MCPNEITVVDAVAEYGVRKSTIHDAVSEQRKWDQSRLLPSGAKALDVPHLRLPEEDRRARQVGRTAGSPDRYAEGAARRHPIGMVTTRTDDRYPAWCRSPGQQTMGIPAGELRALSSSAGSRLPRRPAPAGRRGRTCGHCPSDHSGGCAVTPATRTTGRYRPARHRRACGPRLGSRPGRSSRVHRRPGTVCSGSAAGSSSRSAALEPWCGTGRCRPVRRRSLGRS